MKLVPRLSVSPAYLWVTFATLTCAWQTTSIVRTAMTGLLHFPPVALIVWLLRESVARDGCNFHPFSRDFPFPHTLGMSSLQ